MCQLPLVTVGEFRGNSASITDASRPSKAQTLKEIQHAVVAAAL
jgi:hypothetical protein